MRVEVELKETSQPIVYERVANTYTKGPFYVVYADGHVAKYPIANIWRVHEDYRAPGPRTIAEQIREGH